MRPILHPSLRSWSMMISMSWKYLLVNERDTCLGGEGRNTFKLLCSLQMEFYRRAFIQKRVTSVRRTNSLRELLTSKLYVKMGWMISCEWLWGAKRVMQVVLTWIWFIWVSCVLYHSIWNRFYWKSSTRQILSNSWLIGEWLAYLKFKRLNLRFWMTKDEDISS